MLALLAWIVFGQSWCDLGSIDYKARHAAQLRIERWALFASPILDTPPRNEEQRVRVELIQQRAEIQRQCLTGSAWLRCVLRCPYLPPLCLAEWITAHHQHTQSAWCDAMDEGRAEWVPKSLAWVQQKPYMCGSLAGDLAYRIEQYRCGK